MAEERKDEFLERLWEAYTALLQRARKRVSQATIAKAIAEGSGWPTRQDDVSRWLRGIGRPSYEELPATAKTLGVRTYWLAFNHGPMVGAEEHDDGEGGQGAHFPPRNPPPPLDVDAKPTKKQKRG